MKIKHREYGNKYYYGFLEEPLRLITARNDGLELISKIQKKLKGFDLGMFNEIVSYFSALRIVEIKYEEIFRNNRDKYFDRDFEGINKIETLRKECEKLIDDRLISIDKDLFINSVSEIIYWITKLDGSRQIKIHRDFLSSWAEWHRYLERKNKNKLKGQQIKEKLRIILGDKADDLDNIQKEYEDDVERFKAGRKDIFVNIDHEIDLKSAETNNLLFLPERWLGEGEGFRVIEEHTECVFMDGKKYSLRDYYLVIKDRIDEDWVKSKDLLKQIITIYLIKRCQNGDEEAFNKLFSLYKKGAENVGANYIRVRGSLVNAEEVEGREISILSALLKGDSPSYLYGSLGNNRIKKKGIDVLNKKPYIAINESYEYMFKMINSQYNYLKKLLDDLEKNTKDLRSRSKKAKKLKTKKEYSQHVFTYSQHTLSSVNHTFTLFMMLNPIDLLRISPNYNKYLFKPAPNNNLTTWLLGDKSGTFKGMIWLSLCNLFDKRAVHNDESFDESKYFEEDESGIYKKITENQED